MNGHLVNNHRIFNYDYLFTLHALLDSWLLEIRRNATVSFDLINEVCLQGQSVRPSLVTSYVNRVLIHDYICM